MILRFILKKKRRKWYRYWYYRGRWWWIRRRKDNEDDSEEEEGDNGSFETNEDLVVGNNGEPTVDNGNNGEESAIDDNDNSEEELLNDNGNNEEPVVDDCGKSNQSNSLDIDDFHQMYSFIVNLKSEILIFEDELKDINTRVTVIGFSSNSWIFSTITYISLLEIITNKLNCELGSDYKAGLETIRMFLNKSNNFENYTENKEGTILMIYNGEKILKKTIIFVTSDDSDLQYTM